VAHLTTEVAHGMTGSSSAVTVAATSPYSFSIFGSTVETIETVSTRPGPVAQERPSKATDLVRHGVEACADSPCRAKDGDADGLEAAEGAQATERRVTVTIPRERRQEAVAVCREGRGRRR
jgi:hypothetical protein